MPIKCDFPMLQQSMSGSSFIYLDSAATTHKPQCVIDRVRTFYEREYATVHRAVYEYASKAGDAYERVRTQVARSINAADEKTVLFTKGTTESINLVAYSFGEAFIQSGDEIIISEMEHHANIVPWRLLCDRKGATLKVIPVLDDGTLDMQAYEALLSDKTKLVAVCHVSNVLGTINPVERIIQAAKARGARVLLDGAQAAAHTPIDVQALDCDFYAFSGHKMYGPTGVGILYGKRALLEAMPPFLGGGDMIDAVHFDAITFQPLPLKFEAGTPLIAQVIGLGAAIDYIERIGRAQCHERDQQLHAYAERQLQSIDGLRIVGSASEKVGILSFAIEGVHPLDIGTLMGSKGVAIRTGHMCCQPLLRRFGYTALSRMSFGVYNTCEDIDRALLALHEVVALLRSSIRAQ